MSLISLNLSRNRGWWTRDQCKELLPVVLDKQKNTLEDLEMRLSYFTSEMTERIFAQIATTKLCSTLKTLKLQGSLNFDSDVAVTHFANIL